VSEAELSDSRPVGWQHPGVAEAQRAAFEPLLEQMITGSPRADFRALANALETTGMNNPEIIEMGCGSGWNCLVLETLYKRPFRYTGLDVSPRMIDLARQDYPRYTWTVGNALSAEFPDKSFDILVSGTVLMHVADYRQAIRESARLARCWCIFHTVPVLKHRPTTFLRKLAYGQPAVEIILNERELLSLFEANDLELQATFPSLEYNLEAVLAEPTKTHTYLCALRK
jgi:ubiquinone/menaquinone biosynthesis C-methylase UbiE